ncbi:MAG: ribulose-phosphate 3-epimerase [Ignavibacteria bacterium]|nr:MAG: ribulose-phosphate 3-epimerase [Ignavibacteria bacterium]
MLKIAPSILSADFKNLEQQVRLAERGGADWLHLDIMDGHFVPNLTFGPLVVEAIRSITRLPLDTHLMIEDPSRSIDDFRAAGSTRLTVHVEAAVHLHRVVEQIREKGMKAGIALNPSTPASAIKEMIPFVDLVNVMTVDPGFGGQEFIRPMLRKIREVAEMIAASRSRAYLEVDGGISERNAAELVRAGATVLVAGHSVYARRNVSAAIRSLRKAATR